jgi:lysophospholipase L1-like esterase
VSDTRRLPNDLRAFWIACALGFSSALMAQTGQTPADLLKNEDMLKLAERSGQLADSIAIAVPDLAPASAPLREALRVARENLRMRVDSGPFVMALLNNLRAYQSVMDAMPRTVVTSSEADSQMIELRSLVNKLNAHFQALIVQMEARIRSGDRDNVHHYAQANQLLAAATPRRVVFYGDSITDFWRLNEYFPGLDYVNRGISGQVTSEMLGRFKADVLDLKPAVVVILAGTNDLARGTPVPVISSNITMMAELAQTHRIKVILASVLPVSDYNKAADPQYERTRFRPPALIRTLNDWMRKYCASNGFTYLDYYANMVDKAGLLRAELADDGLHPNASGYRLMAPAVSAAIAAADRAVVTSQPARKKKRPEE